MIPQKLSKAILVVKHLFFFPGSLCEGANSPIAAPTVQLNLSHATHSDRAACCLRLRSRMFLWHKIVPCPVYSPSLQTLGDLWGLSVWLVLSALQHGGHAKVMCAGFNSQKKIWVMALYGEEQVVLFLWKHSVYMWNFRALCGIYLRNTVYFKSDLC